MLKSPGSAAPESLPTQGKAQQPDNLTQQQITIQGQSSCQLFCSFAPEKAVPISAEQEGWELRGESTAGHWREALPHEGCCPQQRKGTDGH